MKQLQGILFVLSFLSGLQAFFSQSPHNSCPIACPWGIDNNLFWEMGIPIVTLLGVVLGCRLKTMLLMPYSAAITKLELKT